MSPPPVATTRDRDTIDRELALLVCVRAAIAESGPLPSIQRIDELLDERATHIGD